MTKNFDVFSPKYRIFLCVFAPNALRARASGTLRVSGAFALAIRCAGARDYPLDKSPTQANQTALLLKGGYGESLSAENQSQPP